MTAKRLVRRRRATRDAEEASDYYEAAGSQRVAYDFIDALEEAYRILETNPGAGSLKYAELSQGDLRAWSLRRFPYIVLYVERDDTVEVFRVLHTHRDIAASLRDTSV